PLFAHLGKMFHLFFPTLHDHYQSVAATLSITAFQPWAAVALNIDFPSQPHLDSRDCKHGLCWVIPFGNWEGGNLQLHDLDVEVALRPGDVVAFRSTAIRHSNTAYTGIRNSLVLFSHNSLFFPVQSPG